MAIGCTLYGVGFDPGMPQVSDLLLAFPIAQGAADPSLYPPGDLLVSAGLRGPFHLYKAAGVLFSLGWQADEIWNWLFLAIHTGLFYSVWLLGRAMTRNPAVAAIAMLAMAVAPVMRGTLYWTLMPLPMLVTATVAVPVGVLALVCAFSGRRRTALLVAGAICNIHPYVGAICLVISGTVLLAAAEEGSRSRRAGWLVAGAACALPNAVYILWNVPFGALSAPGAAARFFEQWRQHAYHNFIEDHWHEGYGWHFLAIASLGWFTRGLSPSVRRGVWCVVAAVLGLYVVSFVNAQFIHQNTVLMAHLVRGGYFLKPVLFVVLAHGLWDWCAPGGDSEREAPRWWRLLVAVFVILSCVDPNGQRADAVLLIALGGVAWFVSGDARTSRAAAGAAVVAGIAQLALVMMAKKWPGGVLESVLPALVAMDVCWALGLFVLFRRAASCAPPEGHLPPRATWRLLGVAALALLGLARAPFVLRSGPRGLLPMAATDHFERARILTPKPPIEGVVRWARAESRPASLWLVPPLDPSFLAFRVTAERGVYAAIFDVNQLGFDPKAYFVVDERLRRIGVQVLGRHRFDAAGYLQLPEATLVALARDEGVDYAVFPVEGAAPWLQGASAVFEDERFRVIDLRHLGD
jgi:hypothetical protein